MQLKSCESLAAASGTDAVASILSCAIAAERNLAGIPPSALILMYHDDEGDLVTVTRSDELMEAVRRAGDGPHYASPPPRREGRIAWAPHHRLLRRERAH